MNSKTLSIAKAIMLASGLLLSALTFAQAPPAPGGGGPDFSKATAALGITATELSAALAGPPPNFVGAAEKFGVSLEEFIALLPAPPDASEIPEGFTAADFNTAE